MNIDVLFQKQGLVPVGTIDQSQIVNLQDPFGKPIYISFNFQTGKMNLIIKSWDDRNEIVRDYEMDLSQQGWIDFLTHIFAPHVRPTAKLNFPEFDNLKELGVNFS